MANANAFINGRQHPDTDVSIVIEDVARTVEIDGLDYTDAADVGLHLSQASEATLIDLLGPDHFDKSFDIHVAFASSPTVPITRDRLVDCRLRATGCRPTRATVMFVRHSQRSM